MRMERRALLIALALVLSAGSLAWARILGGGPAKTDCYAYIEGLTANRKTNGVDCTDGDPTCDGDGAKDGKCTFNFQICTYAEDVPGCEPHPLKKFSPRKLIAPPLGGTTTACADNQVVLNLRKNGKSTKRLINMLAIADGKPSRDPDRLALRCNPAPASPSG